MPHEEREHATTFLDVVPTTIWVAQLQRPKIPFPPGPGNVNPELNLPVHEVISLKSFPFGNITIASTTEDKKGNLWS